MSRLTFTDKIYKYGINCISTPKCYGEGCMFGGRAINKLGELEDIEDKLGIDLVTLFKALENGIYKKDDLDCCFETKLRFIRGEWYLAQPFDENYAHIVRTKDYRKTWGLDKEELL